MKGLLIETSSLSNGICISMDKIFTMQLGQFVCIEVLWPTQPNGVMSGLVSFPNHTFYCLFVFVLRFYGPVQPNGVMLSAASLPSHTFTGQA